MNKIGELREIIKESNNIVFFGGAGVSTESNIPDFRSAKGLYNAKSEYGYSPEDMLSIRFFMNHTDVFYDYYRKNILHTDAEPNDAHIALAKLERIGKLKAIITQNIDGLHQKAGSKEVLELHGTVYRHFCMNCQAPYTLTDVESSEGIPLCQNCGGTIRPDVVLYGEALDNYVISKSVDYIEKADTLIIGGTSLVVYPAAGLITYFKGKNLILINKESTPYDRKANLVINESIGKVLKKALEES
ncbi:MAG: NAD-dependent protein deacylase [Firmicutes bacterium HGW-Firmicutes-18]|nr:MAG: NAD-dependent protein deacylase [Firmicutes bacterium HGW-Firmicutes-18]